VKLGDLIFSGNGLEKRHAALSAYVAGLVRRWIPFRLFIAERNNIWQSTILKLVFLGFTAFYSLRPSWMFNVVIFKL
jgi:hypothetical protein